MDSEKDSDLSDFTNVLDVDKRFSPFPWRLSRREVREVFSGQHLSALASSSFSDDKELGAELVCVGGDTDFDVAPRVPETSICTFSFSPYS